ncbi:Nicotinamidase-related amidase [Loktanella fryxellensis]|uniref:Nicotinamidase-related amidase n=1 Tax=Loktanella fryxellensis TaxID=245187 RepID=A0A1H8CVV8_9RHOB|nr:cysteine hydrolase family protein [Loktanella fryxellensis]SEM99136.1 Nicotinamidase-related amidase [Loktanella fryxellensis]
MTQTALILIDIQNDYFPGGSWEVDRMGTVAANAARLLGHARTTGDLVIHVRHEAGSDTAPFFRPGTSGAEINSAVAPQGAEAVVLKHRPNAFHQTDLLDRLRTAGVADLIVCGAMSQMCVDATVRAAADLGFKVTVVSDACGAKAASFGGMDVQASVVQAAFLAPLAMSYAKVVTTDAALSQR